MKCILVCSRNLSSSKSKNSTGLYFVEKCLVRKLTVKIVLQQQMKVSGNSQGKMETIMTEPTSKVLISIIVSSFVL